MADIKKLNIGGTDYTLKDETARTAAGTADGKAVAAQNRADAAYNLADTANTAAGTADGKAVAAQNRADAAYNLADGKLSPMDTVASIALTDTAGVSTLAFDDTEVSATFNDSEMSSVILSDSAAEVVHSNGNNRSFVELTYDHGVIQYTDTSNESSCTCSAQSAYLYSSSNLTLESENDIEVDFSTNVTFNGNAIQMNLTGDLEIGGGLILNSKSIGPLYEHRLKVTISGTTYSGDIYVTLIRYNANAINTVSGLKPALESGLIIASGVIENLNTSDHYMINSVQNGTSAYMVVNSYDLTNSNVLTPWNLYYTEIDTITDTVITLMH